MQGVTVASRRSWGVVVFGSILGVFLAMNARGDGGGFSITPGIPVFEPQQRAFIVWDGSTEILSISVDLRAARPTRVLEVVPLPSEPVVCKGDYSLFGKAKSLIYSKMPRHASMGAGGPGAGAAGMAMPAAPAARVVDYKRFGPHKISVIQVLNGMGFEKWAVAYLKKYGLTVVPRDVRRLIDEYARRHFVWFAFDLIDVDTEVKSRDAIDYWFPSTTLYYPLRISSTWKGSVSVELVVLSPGLVLPPQGVWPTGFRRGLPAVRVTFEELRRLCPDWAPWLRLEKGALLRTWELKGDLKALDRDIVARLVQPRRTSPSGGAP